MAILPKRNFQPFKIKIQVANNPYRSLFLVLTIIGIFISVALIENLLPLIALSLLLAFIWRQANKFTFDKKQFFS
tara:strand:- start:147 stop:371 length:225 start_codon:yes stop_codon:yes gene_type:complete